jgi:superoxide dismutase, Cu-Zn family
MKRVRAPRTLLTVAGLLVLAPLAARGADTAAQTQAMIEAKSGSTVAGTATFTELENGCVKVVVHLEQAPPGTHGFHIHEKGDCSAPDAMSAGAHFNPASNPHAGPLDNVRHNGDLGNIEIGKDGKGHLEIVDDLVTVKPGPTSVVGKSVIFHEQTDDLKTQPTGNSGTRLGCGVIE